MDFRVQTDRWLEIIRPNRSSDSLFFLGSRPNAKLVHKFPAPLHASRASLQTSISKYLPESSYHTVLKILSNASLRLSNSKQETKNKFKIQCKCSTYFICYRLEQFTPYHFKALYP